MIHFSCDGCGRSIDPRHEMRYSVRIESYAACDPMDESVDADRDSMLEIQEILSRLDDIDDDQIDDDVYRQMRYDLCPTCARKFAESPLGGLRTKQFDFSSN